MWDRSPLRFDFARRRGGAERALVTIDAIATNATITEAIADHGADWLLAVKANQPLLRAEVEAAFAAAGETRINLDKGHGRIEERRTGVLGETDWLKGARRFPGAPDRHQCEPGPEPGGEKRKEQPQGDSRENRSP